MEVTIKVPEKLAAEARSRGVSVEVYVQELLARQITETSADQLESIRRVIDRIVEMRKENRLDGFRIADLIHEGHKY